MTDFEKRRRFEHALHFAGDTHTVQDVIVKVREGRAQYWERGDGSVISEILTYPRLKAVNYWLVSGDLHDCAALQSDIDAWAIEQGCAVATGTGRRGWLRLSQTPFGADWKLRALQFAKPLRENGHG